MITEQQIKEVQRQVLMETGYSPTEQQAINALNEYHKVPKTNEVSVWTEIRDKHCKMQLNN